MGSHTENLSSSRTSVNEPTSSQVTSGVVVNPSRCAEGWTLVSASAKSSMVMERSASSDASKGRRSASRPEPISASAFSAFSASTPVALSPSFAPPSGESCLKMRATAEAAASFASALRSAPTYPGVFLAISARSSPPASLSFLACTPRIRALAFSSGIPSMISRSNRPARRSAASMPSGRLVAPMTVTWPRRGRPAPPYSSSSSSPPPSTPSPPPVAGGPPSLRLSIDASNCATILLSICRPALSRLGTMASTSSMNTMDGAAAAAAENNCRILASDSPDTPATISGAAMEKKGTPASRAMACARVVLPQPGGP